MNVKRKAFLLNVLDAAILIALVAILFYAAMRLATP